MPERRSFATMALAGSSAYEENAPILFSDWKQVLDTRALPWEMRHGFENDIAAFLEYCRRQRAPASIALAKQYLENVGPDEAQAARQAFRWFVRSSRSIPPVAQNTADATVHTASSDADTSCAPALRSPGPIHPSRSLPTLAQHDLGGADWERDIIATLRQKGFLWRSEKTYREWATRFAAFLRPRSPYSAEGKDVAAFLSKLVVEQRASASTQKQALNALVFFMQEALRR